MTEAEKRASAKYQKNKCKSIFLKLNKETDADIIEILERVKNKQGFIKALIRLNDEIGDEFGIFEEFEKEVF